MMSSVFLIVVALMVFAAIALVIYPLLRPQTVAANVESPVPRAAPLAFALAVAVGLGAVGLYAKLNNFPWDNPVTVEAVPAGHGEMGGAGAMNEVTATLEARLAQNPNDLEGWRMLGRTYLVGGNAVKAAAAYERANALAPQKDIDLLLDLAEALVLTDDPAVKPRAQAIIDDALAADAGNQKALWYQGVIAVRAGDKETAKVSWTKLLEGNPPPEIREVIANQLRELGVDVPAGAGANAASPAMAAAGGGMGAGPMGGGVGGEVAPKGRTIRVSVKVDPALASKLQPGTIAVRRCTRARHSRPADRGDADHDGRPADGRGPERRGHHDRGSRPLIDQRRRDRRSRRLRRHGSDRQRRPHRARSAEEGRQRKPGRGHQPGPALRWRTGSSTSSCRTCLPDWRVIPVSC